MKHEEPSNNRTHVKRLAELIKGIKVAMITSRHDDGVLRSRPMMTQDLDFDGTLWFFTRDEGEKFHAFVSHPELNLAYSDPAHQKYVSVSGLADIVKDKAKIEQLWKPFYKAWFPMGVDDPHLVLLKVLVTDAEYWDVNSSLMVQIIGFAKAVFTGKPYDEAGNGAFSKSEELRASEIRSASR